MLKSLFIPFNPRLLKLRHPQSAPIKLALILLVALLLAVVTSSVQAQPSQSEDTQPEAADEQSLPDDHKSEGDDKRVKPWLITPTIAADPKLGANVGGLVAYLKQLDAESTPSMIGLSVSYSDTDSITGGIGAQLFWGGDTRKLTVLAGGAEINNEYDDFLGTGKPVKTQDSVHTLAFRYLHQIREGGWYGGVQGVSTNYAVGADQLFEALLDRIGLTGFDATGVGVVLQHDTMDNQRDPTSGHLFALHNFAYRESLGGESNFDVGFADLRWYHAPGKATAAGRSDSPVFALQAKGRFTHDAPLSGYSSVSLPGYTQGNYLSQHYSHIMIDARFPLTRRLGLVAFGGVGCQFGDDIGGRSLSCEDETYPSIGAGVSFMLKEEASVLVRLEIAKGKSNNEALYLRFGHPF